MSDDRILSALLAARSSRIPCATATIAATTGSVPRSVGAKMLVYLNGQTIGTIGGGKLESLAVSAAQKVIEIGKPILKNYPLHEGAADSFGAICGGEVTVFIEPIVRKEAIFLVGAGHCARAIAKLAAECDFHVSVVDDREDELALCDSAHEKIHLSPSEYILNREWKSDEALVLVSRNFQGDEAALFAVLSRPLPGYLGMIGSRRKVLHVFDELRKKGVEPALLDQVYAPIGLDIGADSPMEIAVSVIAEILLVLRERSGKKQRING